MRENTKYQRPPNERLKRTLSAEQYGVLVEGATEAPFSSEYLTNEREGIYVDAATGEPLFTTFDQFESSCGWPSFTRPVTGECVMERVDASHGMERTEVRSSCGDLHLGHVFTDGPPDKGGLRYCINGAAIRFVALEDMEAEGYGYMLPYLKSRESGE